MAKQNNIVLDQGAPYVEYIDVKVLTDVTLPESVSNPYIPMAITGYTAKLSVRKSHDDRTTVLDITTSNGLTVGNNGRITFALTGAQTSSILFTGDRAVYYYDLILLNGGLEVTRVCEGTFTIKKRITIA